MKDRRRSRSELPSEALLFLLRSIAEREPITAIAVANPAGKLVAGISGSPEGFLQLAELAASAKRIAGDGAHDGARPADEDLFAFAIEVGDAPYFLGTLGARPRKLRQTEGALRRILGGDAPVAHLE